MSSCRIAWPWSSVWWKRSSSMRMRLRDVLAALGEVGILVLHHARDDRDEAVEERRFPPEAAAVEHGAADELAEDVVAAGVAGQDAVADAERRGADVVGDAAEGDAFARRRGPARKAVSVSRSIAWRIGTKRSVSKLVRTPCITAAMRSRPMPVSMFRVGSGSSTPPSLRSNCWKTRFQTSQNRPQLHEGWQSGLRQPTSAP